MTLVHGEIQKEGSEEQTEWNQDGDVTSVCR